MQSVKKLFFYLLRVMNFSSKRGLRRIITRTGIGYDIHPFSVGRALVLGGVSIVHPQGKGLLGHSDADVLAHAIADALLGAAGKRDIGVYFPNTDASIQNISSLLILEKVSEKRGKIIEQVRGAVPALGNFLEFIIFDPDYQGDPAADAAAVKARFSEIKANVGSELDKHKS
jgi:hypothetical protein